MLYQQFTAVTLTAMLNDLLQYWQNSGEQPPAVITEAILQITECLIVGDYFKPDQK
jgi:hypothetical protein